MKSEEQKRAIFAFFSMAMEQFEPKVFNEAIADMGMKLVPLRAKRNVSPGADNGSLSPNETSGPQGAGAPDKEQG